MSCALRQHDLGSGAPSTTDMEHAPPPRNSCMPQCAENIWRRQLTRGGAVVTRGAMTGRQRNNRDKEPDPVGSVHAVRSPGTHPADQRLTGQRDALIGWSSSLVVRLVIPNHLAQTHSARSGTSPRGSAGFLLCPVHGGKHRDQGGRRRRPSAPPSADVAP